MNQTLKSTLIIFLGVFTIFGFASAHINNPPDEIVNQNQPPVFDSENIPEQGEQPLINQSETLPKENPLQVLPQEILPETQLSENIADQKLARQLSIGSPILYPVYAVAIAFGFFWMDWWRKWLKRKKKAELPAEAEKIVCPTCGGAGKITKKRIKTAPCGHCKEKGIETCHACSGTGKSGGGGFGVPLEDIESYPNDCVQCGGKGIAKPIRPCCMCKGKRKEEYEESYEEICPKCKGSGFVNNW